MRQPGRTGDPARDVALALGGVAERGRETRVAAALRARTTTATAELQAELDTLLVSMQEPSRQVGAGGQPGFNGGWNYYTEPGLGGEALLVKFFRDPSGFVYLQGTAEAPGGVALIFTLPTGYWPPAKAIFPGRAGSGSVTTNPGTVVIASDGQVLANVSGAGELANLDGIVFRSF